MNWRRHPSDEIFSESAGNCQELRLNSLPLRISDNFHQFIHQLHRNSCRTMTGNCHSFLPRHSPPVINCLFHASWLSDKYFFPSAAICSHSLSRSTTIFIKSVKQAEEKLKFYSNLNLIHGKKRALKWTKSTESFIDRKQNYSNSCFLSCSLHMRLFGLWMHVIIRYYRNHVINSQFYWYTLA